ncbi:hypothetical protein CBER1_10992 [Cercospora berteroae]|uniref:Uncharacterized protein n=1 Tax=Cercospora berteroae TaxID=357750 RepID=A0A2S6BXD6_9PEZI|nr:hypothetical protein CBER1_10992 [Cercospora berteroae]
MAEQSLFTRFHSRNELQVVEMNEVALLKPTSAKRVIGTRDLNGCSAILVVGKGIILAHISPYPPQGGSKNKSNAGLKHFSAKVKEVVQLFDDNRALFDDETVSWSIFAQMDDETPLEHQLDYAKRKFRKAGLPNEPAYYKVENPRPLTNPVNKGTVVAMIQSDGKCGAYLEGTYLEFANYVPASASQASLPQAESSTSAHLPTAYWAFDPSTQLYHRIENKQWGRSQREVPVNVPILANGQWQMFNGKAWVQRQA